MNLIINEVSLPFESKEECVISLKSFFSIIHLADFEGIGFNHAIKPSGKWNSFHYANGFNFAEWLNKLDSDTSRLVKNVLSKVDCPLATLDDNVRESLGDVLFSLEIDRNIEVSSLGVAVTIGSPVLSFPSHAHWMNNLLSITKAWDDDDEWKEEVLSVQNIFSLESIKTYIKEVINTRQSNKNYLKSLKVSGNRDFPNLIFCKNALKNFSSSSVTSNDFIKIIDALKKLEQAIINSDSLEALSRDSELDISPESTRTMDVAKYRRQREFIHPDMGKVLFEQHVKNFEGGKRMYILADFTSKKLSIGYFGRHLPTVKHP